MRRLVALALSGLLSLGVLVAIGCVHGRPSSPAAVHTPEQLAISAARSVFGSRIASGPVGEWTETQDVPGAFPSLSLAAHLTTSYPPLDLGRPVQVLWVAVHLKDELTPRSPYVLLSELHRVCPRAQEISVHILSPELGKSAARRYYWRLVWESKPVPARRAWAPSLGVEHWTLSRPEWPADGGVPQYSSVAASASPEWVSGVASGTTPIPKESPVRVHAPVER